MSVLECVGLVGVFCYSLIIFFNGFFLYCEYSLSLLLELVLCFFINIGYIYFFILIYVFMLDLWIMLLFLE